MAADPAGGSRSSRRYRYGAWAGGADPLAPPFDVRAAVDAVGEEVLSGGSLREALRDLLRRGNPDGRGLDDLEARARRMRKDAARRGRLDGALTRAQALLDQAVATEQDALMPRDDDEAAFARAQLDALPRSTAAAVRELESYEWASDEAKGLYQQILDQLRDDVLEQRFAGMKQALQGAQSGDPAAMQQMKEMLDDLNSLLSQHASGQDTTDAFHEFMERHGDFFGEDPQDTDELVDALARRAAAGEQLMRSLSSSQRDELAQLMQQAMQGAGISESMAALSENLRGLRPDLPWEQGQRTRGEQPLGYGEATAVLEEMAGLDDLLEQLGQQHPGATLDDVDVEAVERHLGRSAADDVRRLAELERELRRQGWVSGTGDELTLSPKALRRLGQTALKTVFDDLAQGRRGEHDLRDAGASGEATGSSRAWEFGDTQPLDVVRTVGNAVRRSVIEAGPVPDEADGLRAVQLDVEDFEVVETERRAGAAVALCVDLSYSMVAEGRWGPMKQTALAVSHLVATRFPQDALQIIGFGRHAMPLSQGELAAIEPDYQQGTNLSHALMLAARHLRRHSGSDPVVMVVTDGEPTAHLLSDGEAVFSWPPHPDTIAATVHEVDQLTRYGAVLNVFMLGQDPGLRRFVDAIARRSGGRVLTPSSEDLGRYVVDDYLRARRGRR